MAVTEAARVRLVATDQADRPAVAASIATEGVRPALPLRLPGTAAATGIAVVVAEVIATEAVVAIATVAAVVKADRRATSATTGVVAETVAGAEPRAAAPERRTVDVDEGAVVLAVAAKATTGRRAGASTTTSTTSTTSSLFVGEGPPRSLPVRVPLRPR